MSASVCVFVMCVHACVCVCACVCVRVCVPVCACVCVFVIYICESVRACMHACMHACVRVSFCLCVCVSICGCVSVGVICVHLRPVFSSYIINILFLQRLAFRASIVPDIKQIVQQLHNCCSHFISFMVTVARQTMT